MKINDENDTTHTAWHYLRSECVREVSDVTGAMCHQRSATEAANGLLVEVPDDVAVVVAGIFFAAFDGEVLRLSLVFNSNADLIMPFIQEIQTNHMRKFYHDVTLITVPSSLSDLTK